MGKRKSEASKGYRRKGSDYYYSCHLSVSKAKQNSRVKEKSRQDGYKAIRAY